MQGGGDPFLAIQQVLEGLSQASGHLGATVEQQEELWAE